MIWKIVISKIGFKTMQLHLLFNIYLWNNHMRGETVRNYPLSGISRIAPTCRKNVNSKNAYTVVLYLCMYFCGISKYVLNFKFKILLFFYFLKWKVCCCSKEIYELFSIVFRRYFYQCYISKFLFMERYGGIHIL